MSPERILGDLDPPSGGWQRLVARRDAARPEKGIGLPLATAAVLALAVFLLRPQPPQELQLPWTGARLLDQPSAGIGLQQVGGGEVTPLPSGDERVRLYWVGSPAAPGA